MIKHQDTSEIVNNILKEKYGHPKNNNNKTYVEYESKEKQKEIEESVEAYTNDNSKPTPEKEGVENKDPPEIQVGSATATVSDSPINDN